LDDSYTDLTNRWHAVHMSGSKLWEIPMSLEELEAELWKIETTLGGLVMDEQDKCEKQNEEFFKANVVLTPEQNIALPEDACPELDNARTLIQDAIAEIVVWRQHVERRKADDSN